jgi:hypothetical protein
MIAKWGDTLGCPISGRRAVWVTRQPVRRLSSNVAKRRNVNGGGMGRA